MEWVDALIMGIVQGLTEYLPVSSSGHLEIMREILGIDLPADKMLEFDLILHAATVCSTLVVLWSMFVKLCKSFFTFRRDEDFYYVCKLLLSAIPVGIVGVFFKDYVESFFGTNLNIVGICLLVTALLLSFAQFTTNRMAQSTRQSDGHNITWLDSFIIGCAQAIAVLPGLSRSGSTIATGILLRDKRSEVAQFSFLMVIIPILGECLLDVGGMLKESAQGISPQTGTLPLIVGFVASFIVGCAACKWMINIVKRGSLFWFAGYCVLMGIICLLWR